MSIEITQFENLRPIEPVDERIVLTSGNERREFMNSNPDNITADQLRPSPRGYQVRSPWVRNILTFLTEFAAISVATQQMGISPDLSVPIAAVALIIPVTSGSYRRWERITCVLCLLDLTWVAMAILCHPQLVPMIRNTLIPSVPRGGLR